MGLILESYRIIMAFMHEILWDSSMVHMGFRKDSRGILRGSYGYPIGSRLDSFEILVRFLWNSHKIPMGCL